MAWSCRRQQRSGHQTPVNASEFTASSSAPGLLSATVTSCKLYISPVQVALFLGLVWAMVSGKGLGVRFRGLSNTAGGAFAGELLSEPAGSHGGWHPHAVAATEWCGHVRCGLQGLQLATELPCHPPESFTIIVLLPPLASLSDAT